MRAHEPLPAKIAATLSRLCLALRAHAGHCTGARIFLQDRHLRPVLPVERLDIGEIVVRPPRAARPIGPADPHIVILGHETQNPIERVEAGAARTYADLPQKTMLTMLPGPLGERGQASQFRSRCSCSRRWFR